MAAQAIWTGTISFSLVAIPVRLVPAVRPGRVSFHLLHGTDHSRLSRRLFCPAEGIMVPSDEVVRGYELLPDRYIVVTDEELQSVSPERSRTIEILEFIETRNLDPIYFDHPYYLIPSKGGEKAYQLLVEALARTKKTGLAKFVLAEREHLVAVMSRDGALAMTTLHYSSEILPADDMPQAQGTVAADEERRIRKNIEQMTGDFDPGKYSDDRGKKIRELLDKKTKDHAVVEAPGVPMMEEGNGPTDLIAVLEQSMARIKERQR